MKQFVFRVKSSTNSKTSILIKAKSADDALKHINSLGFETLHTETKAHYVHHPQSLFYPEQED